MNPTYKGNFLNKTNCWREGLVACQPTVSMLLQQLLVPVEVQCVLIKKKTERDISREFFEILINQASHYEGIHIN